MSVTVDMVEEGSSDVSTGLRGIECIEHYVKTLDGSPGVYRMHGEKGEVLYVGKARNLRARVKSYSSRAGQSPRIARMVEATASMMFLTTRTETEALLLEQNLIKQLKPRFNVLLRDDKSFPNILVSRKSSFPRIKKHRGAKKEVGNYFGPFASAGAVNRTLNQLQKIFLLRNCSESTFQNRTRPCLLYQIKRCSAPCVGYIDEPAYAELVDDAERFLSGKTADIQRQLAQEMETASKNLEFERAAALRDRIQALTQIQAVQGINPKTVDEADIVGLQLSGDEACVQVFFIRSNQNWGNHAYFPKTGAGAEEQEVLEGFLGQFYMRNMPPRQIFLSHEIDDADLMQEMLSDRLGRKVRLAMPRRGEKAVLVENAVRNAKESLARRQSESAVQKKLLAGLAELLSLESPPARIEVFDNSHIQGSSAVGAMIVVGQDGFMKSSYRKFNFDRDDLQPGDDFAMMKEMLSRRFLRLIKEDPERDSADWPNLIVIDGGAGQLSAGLAVFEELGISAMPIVAVSKGPDRNAGREVFHLRGSKKIELLQNDPVLYFVQRIRDEAHRFAVGSHRTRRKKKSEDSPLSGIPGVGSARKRALLAHFGSAKAVSRAGLEDLKVVPGISASLAEAIYGHFHVQG